MESVLERFWNEQGRGSWINKTGVSCQPVRFFPIGVSSGSGRVEGPENRAI